MLFEDIFVVSLYVSFLFLNVNEPGFKFVIAKIEFYLYYMHLLKDKFI